MLPNPGVREYYDRIAAETIARAQEMIKAGVAIETAFRLCIAWSLETTTAETIRSALASGIITLKIDK